MFDCVGIGICTVDHLCLLPHYPKLDEKIDAQQFSVQGGGPVPTALVTLARLGAKTSFLGVVGDDNNGKFILRQFQKEGVDISAVIIDKNSTTNQAFIWIDNQCGKKSIVLSRNTMVPLLPEEVSSKHITSTRFLHLDGRELEASLAAIKLGRQAGVKIVLDAGSPRPELTKLLHYIDYPIVSESFCRSYLKVDNCEQGVEKLLEFGATTAVITCGARGCYGANASETIYQPAFEVDVVDTTGAGDVFHGAFIFGLLKEWPLAKNLKFAAAAAAIKCTQLGGRAGIPDLTQVITFLEGKEKIR